MDPVFQAMRNLGKKYTDMSPGLRIFLAGFISIAVLIGVVAIVLGSGSTHQYAFTNLTTEDSSEAAGVLKANNISFRVEAGGSALSVPASQVHEARLLLASHGLPRGGGVGFELFDKGDFGASQFTQQVNLRRATEGELARTISRLQAVRSARVHVTLQEKGLYRDDDRRASAAVVLNLQPGRAMQERELAGIRHLVASAVSGLAADHVSIMDQRGTVLSGDHSDSSKSASQQREIEASLEQRIVDLLEPAVGHGAIVAKITASLDNSEVETTQDQYDPESATIRSEHKTVESTISDGTTNSGVAGAAANQPIATVPGGGSNSARSQTNRDDEVRNYEITKKITRTVSRTPRITRLSAAVLVDGIDGKPRAEADVRRLAELAKHAIGFDVQRGDLLEISSAPFSRVIETPEKLAFYERPELQRLARPVGWIALALFGVFLFLRIFRRTTSAIALIQPGTRVSDAERAVAREPLNVPALLAARADGIALRDTARELSQGDPLRAANLLRGWVESDQDRSLLPMGGARGKR